MEPDACGSKPARTLGLGLSNGKLTDGAFGMTLKVAVVSYRFDLPDLGVRADDVIADPRRREQPMDADLLALAPQFGDQFHRVHVDLYPFNPRVYCCHYE